MTETVPQLDTTSEDATEADLDQFETDNPPDPTIEGTTGIEDQE